MAKRISTRKIKKHRLYTYSEAGDVLGVTHHTVRSWRSRGLQVMATGTPHYILGAELIAYLERSQVKRSIKLSLDQMYCFKCKRPQHPLWGMVDYIPINDTRGRMTGLCDVCDGVMQRFVAKGDLHQFDQIYEVTIKNLS